VGMLEPIGCPLKRKEELVCGSYFSKHQTENKIIK
jgi:hypothetical protein